MFLIFNKKEWQIQREYGPFGFCWTDEELDKAVAGDGKIGTKYGVDCYITKPLPYKIIK